MKNAVLILVVVGMCAAGSCKKVCYSCRQYCAYCALKKDSSIIYQVCTDRTNDHFRIDSILNSFPDSTYVCNLLNNETDICDGKNSISQGVTYYEKQNYFCSPQ